MRNTLTMMLLIAAVLLPLAGAADESQRGEVSELAPGIWRVRFGTPEAFTPDAMRARPPLLDAVKALPAPGELPFTIEEISCYIDNARTVVKVPFKERQAEVYGCGLDPLAFKQKGLRKWLTVSAAEMWKTGASHGPVPFYLSTKGYGVYIDTARVATVHVARLDARDGRRPEVLFDLPGNNSGVDVFVFGGPGMREAVQRYNLFSGGGCVPPLWGLGLKYRTYTRADKATAQAHAEALRKWKIPCDMFGLEPGWQTQAYSCSLVWSDERFPDHRDFLDQLQSMGFKVNLWEHAYIHPTSPLHEPLLPRSGDYRVWKGLVVDFADPEASRIFSDYHAQALVSEGVAGFKLDECDRQPIQDDAPWNYPYATRFPSGIDGDQMTQLYGYLYQQSIWRVFRQRNQRTWGDVRGTTALAAPLPFALYSDAYSFEEYLRQLVNASFTGLLWSPEVREAGSYEELVNRLALSSLAPQMCMNPWFVPNPLWEQFDREKNEKNELLSETEQARLAGRMREIVEVRMQLLPYLYAAFHRYASEGLPPMRALILDFPEDPAVRDIDTQFILGDRLMAAPLLGSAATREVYFPAGTDWFDFRTNQRYTGGTTATVSATPGDALIFVRDNTLLPLAAPVEFVAPDTVFQLTVRVYGTTPVPCELIEDDGLTYDYEQGEVGTLTLAWLPEGGKVSRAGEYQEARYGISGWEQIQPLP